MRISISPQPMKLTDYEPQYATGVRMCLEAIYGV
jgi:hypothetical protein